MWNDSPCAKEVGLLVCLWQLCVLLEQQVKAASHSEAVLENRAVLQLLRVAAIAILHASRISIKL